MLFCICLSIITGGISATFFLLTGFGASALSSSTKSEIPKNNLGSVNDVTVRSSKPKPSGWLEM